MSDLTTPNKRARVEEANSPPKTAEDRLAFLEKKGILSNETQARRDDAFRLLNNPSEASESMQNHYTQAQDRLNRILSRKGDMAMTSIPSDVQSFEQFCGELNQWSTSSTSNTKRYIFHKDCERVNNKDWVLKQRSQLSGLCYIHAPDVLQHYLVSMNSQKEVGMVDISKLIRETFTSAELEAHIFNDCGGSSLVMLKRILEKGSRHIKIGSTFPEILCDSLETYGPGLVSGFEVYEDFLNNNVHCHAGIPVGEVVGLHSMVLIGFRVDSAGETYFLLQNWWKRKQFVEVDEEYFDYSDSTVYFVRTPQMAIPNEFDTNMGLYLENENLDKPESYMALER